MNNGKRLRDVDYPRIIFHAPERTFDRLFKESSLYDLKQTVRKKLGLPLDSSISLAQIRDGHAVDLDDDDDFEAFYTVAYTQGLVDVEVRLSETQTSQSTDEEARPRKKRRGNNDSLSMPDNESGVHAAKESKKRKVVFAESSTEGAQPGSASEEPRRKKKKSDIGDTVTSAVVAVVEPSPSHDVTKEKKRKPKKGSTVVNPVPEQDYDLPGPSGTVDGSNVQRNRDTPADDRQPAIARASSPNNSRRQSEPISKSSRRTSTTKDKLPPAPDRALGDQSNARRDSNRENPKSIAEEDDHSASSSENSDDGGLTKNKMLSSRDEHGSKSTSPDAGEENRAEEGTVSGKSTAAQVQEIVTSLLAAKRKLIAGNSLPAAVTTDSSLSNKTPAQSTEPPERTTHPAKASRANSRSICLACSKAPKHDLEDCPLVQEGPAAIQKRIKALRATKKFSDEEKMPVIEGLKRVKQDLRVKAKRSISESKVNAQSHSHLSSRPPDAEANDVSSDRMNDVAGVSSQTRLVMQLSKDSSPGTSSPDSPPSPVVHPSAEKKADGDDSFSSLIPLHNEELSTVDLQELIRGPKDALLSVDDLPSSDENDDDEQRMSGGPEEDEVEKNYPRLTSFRNDSSESEDSDAERDNGSPTDFFTHAGQHDTVTNSQDPIPNSGVSTSQEKGVLQPPGKADVASDKNDSAKANGTSLAPQEPSAVVVKSSVNSQPAITDSVVGVEAATITPETPSTPAEELDVFATQAPESIQSAQSPLRQVNDSPVIEEASDPPRVDPVRRSNRRTKPPVATEEGTAEQDSGLRRRGVTKTPKKAKSLTQVSDGIQNSVIRTMKSKIRAASEVPADDSEPRTPGRKRVRPITKIERALSSKGRDGSTSKPRKKDVLIPGENDLSSSAITPSQDRASLRSATPSVPEWTTLTPMEDDNSIIPDEPDAGSPLSRKFNAKKKGAKKINKQTNEQLPSDLDDNPLFVPSTSQIPYPYSQKFHVEELSKNGRSDSEDEQEVTSSLTPNGRTPHKYRRLSDIGPKPFTKRLNSKVMQHHTSKNDRATELYGRQGKRGDDVGNESDTSSDSDSEPKRISHIPKTRMAGA